VTALGLAFGYLGVAPGAGWWTPSRAQTKLPSFSADLIGGEPVNAAAQLRALDSFLREYGEGQKRVSLQLVLDGTEVVGHVTESATSGAITDIKFMDLCDLDPAARADGECQVYTLHFVASSELSLLPARRGPGMMIRISGEFRVSEPDTHMGITDFDLQPVAPKD